MASPQTLESVFHHLVLPPKIPTGQDSDLLVIENYIFRLLQQTCTSLVEGLSQDSVYCTALKSIKTSLEICQALHSGPIDKTSIQNHLQFLGHEALILYIRAQNSALLIRRDERKHPHQIIFEAFEASPLCTSVLETKSALTWTFPGRAAALDYSKFSQEDSLAYDISSFLDQASGERIARFQPHVGKAGASVPEDRETTDPALIIQFLMPLLESKGSDVYDEVDKITKRIRDDVSISNSVLPWRRCPLWLVLKVSIQKLLISHLGMAKGNDSYKILITTMLAHFLRNTMTAKMSPEITLTVNTKICRRLTKLESMSSELLDHFTSFFMSTVKDAVKDAKERWQIFCETSLTKHIDVLPSRAPLSSRHLTLHNSGPYLSSVLTVHQNEYSSFTVNGINSQSQIPPIDTGEFWIKLANLSNIELKVQTFIVDIQHSTNFSSACNETKYQFDELIRITADQHTLNPIQNSLYILLLFELWILMDKFAILECPVLADFHPIFSPELLDCLLISKLVDMQRLNKVQDYLGKRVQGTSRSIFSTSTIECFAFKYLQRSPDMQALGAEIEAANLKATDQKRREWNRLDQEFTKLTEKITNGICTCTFNKMDGTKDIRGCQRCYFYRQRRRLHIDVHENYLPQEQIRRAIILFELRKPSYLSAYRDATWQLISMASCDQAKEPQGDPMITLDGFAQLQRYRGKDKSGNVSVVSKKKSWLQTHYNKQRMPVDVDSVILPCGFEPLYFDLSSKSWITNDFELSFNRLCGVEIPQHFQKLHSSSYSDVSSYDIIASIPKCPPSNSIREFTACQKLFSASANFWITMLVELGSVNINFNNPEIMDAIHHVAILAGPSSEVSFLRERHRIFDDINFCNLLENKLVEKVEALSSNWREIYCMNVLITLSARLYELQTHHRSLPVSLISARNVTLNWIDDIRNSIQACQAAEEVKNLSFYGFWAALLCRRTLVEHIESHNGLTGDELFVYARASIAFQENLVKDLNSLPQRLKNLITHDAKQVFKLKKHVAVGIQQHPEKLSRAVFLSFGLDPEDKNYTITRWIIDETFSDGQWVKADLKRTAFGHSSTQVLQFNFVQGYLLANGKMMKILPAEIRESESVKMLFGNEHLLARPSTLHNMDYMITLPVDNQEVHFGQRGTETIIQLLNKYEIRQFIPSTIFKYNFDFDLPLCFIDGCVHWFNFSTLRIEIRSKKDKWKGKIQDWYIDYQNKCFRNQKATYLVDTKSSTYQRIATIFSDFVDAQHLFVFQPEKWRLSVEIRHMGLYFFVNKKGLLECKQLNAEIETNQNVGALHGFVSKIVLRHVKDTSRRMLICPLGNLNYSLHGMHVKVSSIRDSQTYVTYEIDSVLGRLTCAPELRLSYFKAQLHAFTSFIIPDSLTGRTGTEEAMEILQSGYCQPWQPLLHIDELKNIESLAPKRSYYPPDKRMLQKIQWDPHLTWTIQHECYRPLINRILKRFADLREFHQFDSESVKYDIQPVGHLDQRAICQRYLYEQYKKHEFSPSSDVKYKQRDQKLELSQSINISEVVHALESSTLSLGITKRLSSIASRWKLVGGFSSESFSSSQVLSDLIETKVSEQWGSLFNMAQTSDVDREYSLLFRLCLLAFSSSSDVNVLKYLVAIRRTPELRSLETPQRLTFRDFNYDLTPSIEPLRDILNAFCRNINVDDSSDLKRLHKRNCQNECDRIMEGLERQWPNGNIEEETFEFEFIKKNCLEPLKQYWIKLQGDLQLSQHFDIITQTVNDQARRVKFIHNLRLDSLVEESRNISKFEPRKLLISNLVEQPIIVQNHWSPLLPHVSLQTSGMTNGHEIATHVSQQLYSLPKHPSGVDEGLQRLQTVLQKFQNQSNGDSLRENYHEGLENSLTSFRHTSVLSKTKISIPTETVLDKKIKAFEEAIQSLKTTLQSHLADAYGVAKWLVFCSIWPRMTCVELLEQLRSTSESNFGGNMHETLVTYGLLLLELQRLTRVRASLKNLDPRRPDFSRVTAEWNNIGHQNWDPHANTDWLLMELDSNMLIRPEQFTVAQAIIKPSSGSNCVLQLNMGKGKTSCIMPMAALSLSSNSQLSRLIVPKALLFQTAQVLQARIGGLVGRDIMHLPFSRRTKTSSEIINTYLNIHKDMLNTRGILLSTPEHVLSFKLGGLQKVADNHLKSAKSMIYAQNWLDKTCRDILDESDLSLATKTQLIYPSGTLVAVDGSPYRWKVVQELLSMVEDRLSTLQEEFPESLEAVYWQNRYPIIYIVNSDVEDRLHLLLIEDICNGRLDLLKLKTDTDQNAETQLKSFLRQPKLDHSILDSVVDCFIILSDEVKKMLLLVHGLIHNRIIVLCLKKRWNIQYGLNPKRDPIAVPFEGKDHPSEQAEFGHPDVAIIFTCLSFYYTGLNLVQFKEGLNAIIHSTEPANEYERWIHGSDHLPSSLRLWNLINLEDSRQVQELWLYLRFARRVVNHYVNTFVFPNHAKQFSVKLQLSAWDLPQFGQKQQTAMTTGFSGTNDNRFMLPLNIQQQDLDSLRHTNAEVLCHLLEPRNEKYFQLSIRGKRMDEEQLLYQLRDLKIRVLIDAGAFVLEMSNQNLVTKWLKIDGLAKAAVYFDDRNRAWVIRRDFQGGQGVPLLATHFADNLEECLVYLDEAHTRGIDLKLPANAVGALTLGLNQTKDHTVQAAMRLRQLGSTQSLVFFAPPEVDKSIRDVCQNLSTRMPNSSDVVLWLLHQSCNTNEQLRRLYLNQGRDFCRRMNAHWDYPLACSDKKHQKNLLKVICQPDRTALEDLYSGTYQAPTNKFSRYTKLASFMEDLENQAAQSMRQECFIDGSALEEVEQEREVEVQVEEERQVQKRVEYKALEFNGLDEDVLSFIKTGNLSGDFDHIFTALGLHTLIGFKFGLKKTSSKVFVSHEFMRTVKSKLKNDNLIRPIEWILWSPLSNTALIIITEELNCVLDKLLSAVDTKVHLIAYSTPLSKSMVSFSKLNYFAVPALPDCSHLPRQLLTEISIASGGLYFDYDQLAHLQEYINSPTNSTTCPNFCRNPLGFMLEWLSLRQHGQDISHTAMGYVLQQRPLKPDHPFFCNQQAEQSQRMKYTSGAGQIDEDNNDNENDYGQSYFVEEDYEENES